MAENYEDPSKKRRLDEEGTSSAFADSPANARKEKLEAWLKPLNNEQLFKLLLDMCAPPIVSTSAGLESALRKSSFGRLVAITYLCASAMLLSNAFPHRAVTPLFSLAWCCQSVSHSEDWVCVTYVCWRLTSVFRCALVPWF